MRELSGCDFCGGTAAGTFEVLPAEQDPKGEGKRMLLCDHCHDVLSSVIRPVLDRNADAGQVNRGPSGTDNTAESVATGDVEADPEDGLGESGANSSGTTSSRTTQKSDEEIRAETRMAATGAGSSSRVPRGYRKVLRFLENREFPLARKEAIEMTAGAYGMEDEAVDAAIDHAVKHGRLKAYDGELRQT